MIVRKIPQVLDQEVVSVTKTLAGMELKRTDSKQWNEYPVVADVIRISGSCKARIICEARREVFYHIISAMYGGGLPPEEERALYVNEYMNIICGQIVSRLNDLTGECSKLSVPEYYVDGFPKNQEEEWSDCEVLTYCASQDAIRFTIHYMIQKNGGEIT